MTNCLIVDDAPIARDILVEYCRLLPTLKVVGTCSNAFEARERMQQESVDILLLDINMPILNGIDLVRTLRNAPQIIFTTAYKEYAVDAFDLAACDYLVKPFSLERFIIAVDKALENLKKSKSNELSKPLDTLNDSLLIRTDRVIHKVNYEQILFLEASRNNTKIVTSTETYLNSMALSSMEKNLPLETFTRVHRSFIVNKSKITSLQGSRIVVSKHVIPLGSNYKNDFFKDFGLS